MEKPADYDSEPQQKFYAVRSGIKPGIYQTWEECKANVLKVPGAIFKAFETEEEAQAFIDAAHAAPTLQDIDSSKPVAYIDGSYKKDPAQYGYGGFLQANGKTYILQGTGNNPLLLAQRNIAGEIYGATMAIKKAQDISLTDLTIVYDYAGVEKWALGEWECNSYLPQWYSNFFKKAAESINIKFIHVDGHTGVTGNEMADILAKQAVGAKLRKKDIAVLEAFRAAV